MKNRVRLSVNVLVLVLGILLAACGSIPPGMELQGTPGSSSALVEFTGAVDSMAASQWVVAGQTLVINPQTSIDAGILVGELVKVHATIAADARVTADKIERYTPDAASTPGAGTGDDNSNHFADANHAEFTGMVQTISKDAWVISSLTFAVTSQTEIKDTIIAGDTVKVEAVVNADGTFTATEIRLATASASGTPVASLDDSRFEMAGTVQAIAADQWNISGKLFAVDTTAEVKGTINAGDVVKVEAQVRADGTFLAREIQLADLTSSTPQAGSTDNSNVGMEFTGVVQSIGPTSWTIGGKTFVITAQTEIKGSIAVGDTVKVETFGSLTGTLTARQIKKVDGLGGGTSVPGSGSGDDHGGSSSTDNPASTAQPTDDHGGGSGKP